MIVDAGAFLGTSAFALASGLAHSPNPATKRMRVFSYDLFVADEEYVAANIRQRFPHFANGQRFRDLYDAQVGLHSDLIVAIEGDFAALRWLGLPIEILFVDLDKSPQLHAVFLREYYTKLIPGHSLVLLQDWYLSRHPWLHFGMEHLSEYFSLVDPLVPWCTRVFRLEKELPAEEIETLANGALGYEREVDLMDKLIAREDGAMKRMLQLSRISHMVFRGDRRCISEFAALEAEEFSNDGPLETETAHVRALVRQVAETDAA